jgi:hypothetical protein
MPVDSYILRLATGRYYAGTVLGVPRSTDEVQEAKSFVSRLEALEAAAKGPAAFWERATILRRATQEPAQACGDGEGPPDEQRTR